ncbi:MAG TPA: hypothetical protein VF783_19065 [Terriglobales bacterium]
MESPSAMFFGTAVWFGDLSQVEMRAIINISNYQVMTERPIRVGVDDAPPPPMQLGNSDTADFRGDEVDVLKEVSPVGRNCP